MSGDGWGGLTAREKGLRLGVSLLARWVVVIGVQGQVRSAAENIGRQSIDEDERQAIRLVLLALESAERQVALE